MGYDKSKIEMHISNAGASLDAASPKWAFNGLISAITAKVMCEEALTVTSSKEKVVWLRGQLKDASRLIEQYKAKYRLSQRESNGTGIRRDYTDEDRMNAILEALNYPVGTADRTRLIQQVGEKYGIPYTTLFGWLRNLENGS